MEEIVSKRSINSKSFDLENGQTRVEISQHTLHYKQDDDWLPIDTNIEFELGFGYKIKKANYNLRFFENKLRFGFSKNVYIEYGLPSDGKTITNNICSFANAWNNTDLEYICENKGIKNNIILNNSEAPMEFNFPVSLQNCSLEVIDNSVNIISNDAIIGIIPAPYMIDGKGNIGDVAIGYNGDGITFVADSKWLETAVYPVIIDPSTYQTAANGDDGNSYDTNQFTASGNTATIGNTYTGFDLFARFPNVTVAQGSTITAANISYLSAHTVTGSAPITKIHLNKSTNAVAPTNRTEFNALTLSTAYTNWTMPNVNNDAWYDSPDIASVVQEIVNQGSWASGNAMMLLHKNNGSSSNYYRNVRTYEFGSTSGPKLVITYSSGTQYNKTVTANVSVVGSIARNVNKAISASVVASSAIARATNKTVSANVTISSNVQKLIQKSIDTSVGILSDVSRATICNKILSTTINASASVTKVVDKVIIASVSIASNISRSIAKSTLSSIVAISTIQKDVTKTLDTNVLTSANVINEYIPVGAVEYPKTLSCIINVTSLVSKETSKVVSSTIDATAVVQRVNTKTVSSNIAVTVGISKGIGKLLLSTFTALPNTQRTSAKTISSNVAVNSIVSKSIAKNVSAIIAITPLVQKNITKTLSSIVSVSENFIASFAYTKILTTLVNIDAIMSKSANKTILSTVSIANIVSRNITKAVSNLVSVTGVIRRSTTKTMNTDVSVSASSTQGIAIINYDHEFTAKGSLSFVVTHEPIENPSFTASNTDNFSATNRTNKFGVST